MKDASKIPVLVFFGATASGKTGAAYDLFAYNSKQETAGKAEIISADSIQVYKYMRIGSALPDNTVLENLPHHLIEIKEPYEEFSAADFVNNADVLCSSIYNRKKLPVLLGGTAFYLKNFLYGLPVTPPADSKVRKHFQNRAETEGSGVLLEELHLIDPPTAEKLHVNDAYRIIRAHEVFAVSGKPLSSFLLPDKYRPQYDFLIISLERRREELYRRIEQRVDLMINSGLKDEFTKLYKSGFTAKMPALKAIGYKEFFEVNNQNPLNADISTVAGLIKRNTKRYAKRQETFFKKIPNVKRFLIEGSDIPPSLYKTVLDFYSSRF